MGIEPTIENTIAEFRRATRCRMELDGGGTVIAGTGPLMSAAHFLEQQQDEIARLRAEVARLEADAALLSWILTHPETAAEELEDAVRDDSDPRANIESRRAGIDAARAGGTK